MAKIPSSTQICFQKSVVKTVAENWESKTPSVGTKGQLILKFFKVFICTLSPTSPGEPKKNCTKKGMLFLAFIGETGLAHEIFFEFSLRPFEVVEVE